MNSNKNLIVSVSVIVVVVIALIAYFAGRTSSPSQPQPQNIQTSSSTEATATTTQATTTVQVAPATSAVSHPTSAAPAQTSTGPAGSETLHVGQVVSTASGATITVVSVSDNRCPLGSTCTSAGTVSANIKLQKGIFVQSQILTLGIPTTEYGFTAELVSVSPQRSQGVAIPQSSYALVFTVK